MFGAAPAQAAPVNVNATCGNLQAALTTAQGAAQAGLDNAYTITLDGICTGQYTLPAFGSGGAGGDYKFFTLRGDPAAGAAIDGFAPTSVGRALTGVDVHRTELQNLTFRDGQQDGDGGAIHISGRSSLAVRFSKFFNNYATGKGGAIHFTQAFGAEIPIPISLGIQESEFGSLTDPTQGNSADGDGGAVSVDAPGVGSNSGINGSLLANNTAGGNGGAFDWAIQGNGADNINLDNTNFASNQAAGSGGGGRIKIGNATQLQIRSNRFEGNAVQPISGLPVPPAGSHFGGGLYIENGGSSIFQDRNTFGGNEVKTFTNGQDYGGGAQAVINTAVAFTNSELDTFTGNAVAGQPDGVGFDSEGGGIYFRGEGATFRGRLAAVTANTVGANGSGGGIYVGAVGQGTTLELNDSTVAGNSVGAGGTAPGLAGNGNDRLKLRNSVVWNLPKPDIAGFSPLDIDIAYSDACIGTNTVPSGTGNICADPLLANAAAGNIHQTTASPTVDKGSDAAFFAVAGEGPFIDFEGDPRPTDGDGDGHTTDMGADEGPAFVRPVVPVIPGGVTSSGVSKPQCADARDNDGDGAVDTQDPGCSSASDANEGDESVRDLVLCGRRTISLVRADLRGGRVRLSGLVASKVARRPVTILANYGGQAKGSAFTKRATVRANSKGQFSATLPRPPKRFFTKARFQARVGSSRSAALKLPQSLASDSIRKSGASIVIRGKVDRGVLGKRNAVVIQRLVCGRLRTVGSAKPDKRGRYTVRFKAPALGTAALYRATSRVLRRPGSKRYVRQFARAVGITLTGQSG